MDAAQYFPFSSNGEEVAISKDFFKHPSGTTIVDNFNVGLNATNGDNSMSKNMIFFKVNQPPENGTCFIDPKEGYSVITEFQINCEDWVDPEDKIKQYTVAGL